MSAFPQVKTSYREVIKSQHREIDLQRPVVEGRVLYQSMCSCGRRAEAGSKKHTQMDQKFHRWEMIREARVHAV